MKRRNFLPFLTAFPILPLCSIGYLNQILKGLITESNISLDLKNKNTLPFTLKELFLRRPTDLIEIDPYYLRKMRESFINNIGYIEKNNKISKIKISKGNILILGSFHYNIVSLLKRIHKTANCIGFDSVQSANQIRVVKFGWNNVFTNWENNPRLKLSGFNFLKETLVPGGYLIDSPINELPKDLNTNSLKLIATTQLSTTWRKNHI